MACQNYHMSIVSKHILNFLVKCTGRNGHGFDSELVHSLLAHPDATDSTTARHVKREISRAGTQVSIEITASKRGVRFASNGFEGMGHFADLITNHPLGWSRIYFRIV
jgi:hypothetical protein